VSCVRASAGFSLGSFQLHRYRFIGPQTDTAVYDVAVEATDLVAALKEFGFFYWDEDLPITYAVFCDGDVIGRIIPLANAKGQINAPEYEAWPE
jgi:hypothetical protein